MRTISKQPIPKTGILLINLGTPEATDFRAVRRYLKQFLSDKNVVPARGPIWWLILHLIILRRRPHSLGQAYDAIWNKAQNESPLRTFTRAQSQKLTQKFHPEPLISVNWAMRYGTPSITDGLSALLEKGCTRILLFPLYPQYSLSTTGSAIAEALEVLKPRVDQPTMRSVAPYFDHPAYISALANSIRAHHATLPWKPDLTIASLHGLPVDFIAKGDPYQNQCEATVKHLRRALKLGKDRLLLTYQSRSNRKEWIGPDTEETLIHLAQKGVRNISLVAPGFAADGVETLEELGLRAVKAFQDAGGENITLVPCLNASDQGITMLETLIRENLWVATDR